MTGQAGVPAGRGGPRARAILGTIILAIMGCVLLGVGISGVGNATAISAHGVLVRAVVLQNQGWGRYAILVGYSTASGQHEQGTLDTPAQASSYSIGSAMTVAYDPASPAVVALPGAGSSGAWAEVGVGSAALLLLAAGGASKLWRDRANSGRLRSSV